MSLQENLPAMRRTAWELLDDFLLLFDRHLKREGDRAWVPYGSLPPVERLAVSPDDIPSSRLTCDVALAYLVASIEGEASDQTGRLPDRTASRAGTSRPYGDNGAATACRGPTSDERLQTALALLRHAFTRQHPKGWFVWNYGQCEIDQVDLGTVLDTYHYFWTLLGEKLSPDIRAGIVDSTRRAVAYLKTAEQPQYPGVTQKRAPDPDHPGSRRTADYQKIDVLNGNALAITAFCRAAHILGDESLIDEAARYQKNLVESFGRHVPGWWVYIEWLADRSVQTPETYFYQAMTALYLEPLYRARPKGPLREVLAASLRTLADATSPEGEPDWSREARKDFIGTPLLMFPSAAAALADVCDVTDAARRRLELAAATLYDRKAHWFLKAGPAGGAEPAHGLIQIWTASDLALIILFARRFEHGLPSR